jgi:hypothetical protein
MNDREASTDDDCHSKSVELPARSEAFENATTVSGQLGRGDPRASRTNNPDHPRRRSRPYPSRAGSRTRVVRTTSPSSWARLHPRMMRPVRGSGGCTWRPRR